jgi:hypothetical protein
VVDWDGLENRCAFTGTVGSNPTLSAKKGRPRLGAAFFGGTGEVEELTGFEPELGSTGGAGERREPTPLSP